MERAAVASLRLHVQNLNWTQTAFVLKEVRERAAVASLRLYHLKFKLDADRVLAGEN